MVICKDFKNIWFFSSNSAYNNTGHFIDFSPKKLIFSSKFACISSTILTFLPNNPLRFYTKNTQKVIFSSNCDYNRGHFIDFSPEKSDISSKCHAYRARFRLFWPIIHCVFIKKNPKKFLSYGYFSFDFCSYALVLIFMDFPLCFCFKSDWSFCFSDAS